MRTRFTVLLAALGWAQQGAAQPSSSNTDVTTGARTEVTLGDAASLSVAPPLGSDIDPGPAPEVVAGSWRLAQQPFGSASLPMPPFAPPLRFKLELRPLFGLAPFVSTDVGAHGNGLSSTRAGASFAAGRLRLGSHFSLSHDDRALWLQNTSFVRYVEPTFDLGVQSLNAHALGGHAPIVQRAVTGSVGIHPDPEQPALRLNAALFPQSGAFSSVSAFGVF